MSRYLKRNVNEIQADPALRGFLLALVATHFLTFVLWNRLFFNVTTSGETPFCWPAFQSCYRVRPFSEYFARTVLYGYLALTFLNLGVALRRRWTQAYSILCLLTFLKFILFIQDYRLMGNYHYILFLVSAVFLFIPCKRAVIQGLLVAIYIAAGTLKLNYEWLSAASLGPRTYLSHYLPQQLLELLCAYAVVLELVFSWFLLAPHRVLFALTFAQFIFFHIFSWQVVPFYYPTTMFCLLTIFPLCRYFADEAKDLSLDQIFKWKIPRPVMAVTAVFAIAQLVPRLTPGDSALTAEGRMFALNMFDARAECFGQVVLRSQKSVRVQTADFSSFGTLLHCDPLLYYDYARALCRSLGRGEHLDLHLVSKRTTQAQFKPVIRVNDFCKRDLRYSMFGQNEWVIK